MSVDTKIKELQRKFSAIGFLTAYGAFIKKVTIASNSNKIELLDNAIALADRCIVTQHAIKRLEKAESKSLAVSYRSKQYGAKSLQEFLDLQDTRRKLASWRYNNEQRLAELSKFVDANSTVRFNDV